MFRPEIKVIDCTVRDGGLMNKWRFDDAFVCKVYQALNEAGIDYMEIGYLSSESSFSRDEFGPWKFCAEEDISRVIGGKEKRLKLYTLLSKEAKSYPSEIIHLYYILSLLHQLEIALDPINS